MKTLQVFTLPCNEKQLSIWGKINQIILHVKNYFYPWSSFIKSVTTVCNSLLKVIDENFSRTRSNPAFPKRSASSGSFTNLK